MGGRLREQRGENEKKVIWNFINNRETRQFFAGGAVIEISQKIPLILSEEHQL